MRASKNRSPDEIRERYLGEIAPLIEAARNLDTLSSAQKKVVRRRVLRTVFGTRAKLFRFRLTPVMVGVGLLVAGGVAFATAERLGLIHRQDQGPPNLKRTSGETYKRKSPGPKRGVQQELAAPAGSTDVVLPDVPDPLLTIPPPVGELVVGASTVSVPRGEPRQSAEVASGVFRPSGVKAAQSPDELKRIEKTSRYTNAPTSRPTPAPVSPASSFAVRPAQPTRTLALATPYLAEPMMAPPPAGVVARPPATLPAPTAYPAPAPTPPAPPPLPIVAPVVQPPSAPAKPAPSIAPPPATAKPVASDPVLFGQALRKLRNEDDPTAALAALQQHAQAYPRSAFSGERSALEVEALLALHRDREALQKLDGMSLERLPRGGERLVVRGELRASARRWLDAKEDFDRALSLVSGSPAWHERALWGRGVARLRCGERAEGMEDLERYHDLYPKGRFAAEASRFFPNK
jgi:TolA-binding protein